MSVPSGMKLQGSGADELGPVKAVGCTQALQHLLQRWPLGLAVITVLLVAGGLLVSVSPDVCPPCLVKSRGGFTQKRWWSRGDAVTVDRPRILLFG
mmetsp:Transcript_2864/g.4916  ORF Transcript_2864/g.4916 Transcript_2864/m.4916 type:complete len:96 (-) Transcript_2864:762-1049(-)